MKNLILILLFMISSPAMAKDILVVRGLFGDIVAPMTEITDSLRAAGHNVTVTEWWNVPKDSKWDVAIGHSAGGNVLETDAKLILTIDPSPINAGCPEGSKCINWYSPLDKYPFLLCCGGWPVAGADNRKVGIGTPSLLFFSPGHIDIVKKVVKDVVNEAQR